MVGCVRNSTSALYQSRCAAFSGWYHGRGCSPLSRPMPLGRGVSSLTCVRRAPADLRCKGLSSPELGFRWLELSPVFLVCLFWPLRGFGVSCPPRAISSPVWVGSLVRRSLPGLRSCLWYRWRGSSGPPGSPSGRPWRLRSRCVCFSLSDVRKVGVVFPSRSSRSSSGSTGIRPSSDPRFEGFSIPGLPWEGADVEK